MGKDTGKRPSLLMRIPKRYPVLRLVFDHTVWIKARLWHADQMKMASEGREENDMKGWLEEQRERLRQKYPEIAANGRN